MSYRRGSSLIAAFFTLLLSYGGVAAQDVREDDKGRSAFEAGRAAFERGQFTEALALFEHAHRLTGKPELLFNIGRAAEEEGYTSRASEAYEQYLVALPEAPNRGFVEVRLQKLRARAIAAPARAGSPRVEPAPARATPPARRLRAYGGIHLAAGGKHYDDYDPLDLGATFGIQFGAGWVWRVFGLGGEVRWDRVSATGPDYGEGRDVHARALSVVLKPRVGHKLASLPLELYAALPHGFSTHRFSDQDFREYGFAIGLLGGASYFFKDRLGGNLEFGWEFPSISALLYSQLTVFRLNLVYRP